MVTHVSTISSAFSSCMFHLNCVTAYPDSLCSFSFTSNYKRKSAIELNITIIAVALLCFLTTSFSYFHVLRVIRRHQQQVQASQCTIWEFWSTSHKLGKIQEIRFHNPIETKSVLFVFLSLCCPCCDVCSCEYL